MEGQLGAALKVVGGRSHCRDAVEVGLSADPFKLPERSTEVGWTIIDRTERIIEPIEPTTDGPGGGSRPPWTPSLASAFGDTDGEFFSKNLQTTKKSRGWLGF